MTDSRVLFTLIWVASANSYLQNGVSAQSPVPPIILPVGPGHEGNDTILLPGQEGRSSMGRNDAKESLPETPSLHRLGGNEGDDILYTPEQLQLIKNRKAIANSIYYWTEVNGFPLVRYAFNDTLVNQTAVRAAIASWESNTCIKYQEVSPGYPGYHIYFQRDASACNSYVGMVFSTGQPINVPVWCEQEFGSLVHEIGHAMGFFHEQQRTDRDSYVQINSANIQSAAYAANFNLQIDNNFSVPYDYSSDMHYGERAFDSNGQITIATRNPFYQGVIGWRGGLSHMDILLANRMYNCISKYLTNCSLTTDPCQNYGFMGRNCQCVCPPGTSGSNCETLVKKYNDVRMSNYSVNVTTEGVLTSPNYPAVTIVGEKYSKWIQSPPCTLVRLTFNAFNTYQRVNSSGVMKCLYEGLEIRTSNMYDGTWYCGTEIPPGFQITSTSNQMIVYFTTYVTGYSAAKWSANVSFVPDPNCSTTSMAPNTTTVSTTTLSPNTTTVSTTTLSPNTTTVSTTTLSPNTTTESTTTLSPNTTTVSTTTLFPNTTTGSTTTLSPNTTTLSTTTLSPNTTTVSTTTLSPNTTTVSTTTLSTNTTTVSTTTLSPVPECNNFDNNGLTRFVSPNYPNTYPANAICTYERLQKNPMYARLRFATFKLAAGDKLKIEHPFGPPLVFVGTIKNQFHKIPGQFKATFTSDGRSNSKGFAIDIEDGINACHQNLSAAVPGLVKTQNFPNKHGGDPICQWRIKATPAMRVRVTIQIKRILCNKGYVAVNPDPDNIDFYDSSVENHCGSQKTIVATSYGQDMAVFYTNRGADFGFQMSYTEEPLI